MPTSKSEFQTSIQFYGPVTTAARPRLSREERQAVADLISVVRSVRYDVNRDLDTNERYLAWVGRQILEVAQSYKHYTPRDWDKIMTGMK